MINPDVDDFNAAYCPPTPWDQGVATTNWATGYMAPSDQLTLLWNSVYTYDYTLVVGNVSAIRSTR